MSISLSESVDESKVMQVKKVGINAPEGLLNDKIFIFVSCQAIDQETEFNTHTIIAQDADNQYETFQEQSVQITYRHDFTKANIAPTVTIYSRANNGRLTYCEYTDDLEFKCIYTPNDGFFGVDTFSFIAKDGEIISSRASVIQVNVRIFGPRLDLVKNQKRLENFNIVEINIGDEEADYNVNNKARVQQEH